MIICTRCGEKLAKLPGTNKFVSYGIGGYMDYCPDQRILASYENTEAIKHKPKETEMNTKPDDEISDNDGTSQPDPEPEVEDTADEIDINSGW